MMQWASTVSLEDDLDDAVAEAAAGIRRALGDASPDLAVVFVSRHHQDLYARVPAMLRKVLGGGVVLGCAAGGVIGGGSEVEDRPGVSVTAAVLPDVDVIPFHLETGQLPPQGSGPRAWEELLRVGVERSPHFLLLPDPYSFEAERFLTGVDAAFPGGKKIGGLASGGQEAGANALYVGANIYRAGAVGVALCGNVEVDTVVAQGCRPVGDPMFVTRCDHNVLVELDGRPPVDMLRELYGRLGESDRALLRNSLFLGIVMNEHQQRYCQGDFLIRNLMGVDEDSGALAIGAMLREGLVVQFHLRDAKTSADDLEELLSRYANGTVEGVARPQGSLLFSCLGRGANLYGHPDHDTDTFRRHLGEVPLGGFFCNGEIGDVHGRTFLHGYTSSFGLFRSRGRA